MADHGNCNKEMRNCESNPAMLDYERLLQSLAQEGRLRHIPPTLGEGVKDFCSNDYMGLNAASQAVYDASEAPSSSSSRLLCSRQEAYISLESELGRLYGKSALIFNSGYHLNTGAIQALASIPGTVILCDRLSHASIIDGVMLSKAPFERFRHNDMNHLRRLIEKHSDARRLLVVTESIFSMDGDEAPLRELTGLRREFRNIILYVDEAHAFGVRGERGLGLAEEQGLLGEIDFVAATFGKAAASMGAFAATTPLLRDVLLNCARSFIFSTALPPAVIAQAHNNVVRLTTMAEERRNLARLSALFREGLERITGRPSVSASQIVPWIIGDARKASEYSRRLSERGYNVLPIRRPTVPPGTERLRFSLNASMRREDISALMTTIEEIISQ